MLLETIETPSFIGKRHARPPEFEIERERETVEPVTKKVMIHKHESRPTTL